jgi:hypothetical protein
MAWIYLRSLWDTDVQGSFHVCIVQSASPTKSINQEMVHILENTETDQLLTLNTRVRRRDSTQPFQFLRSSSLLAVILTSR